MPVKLSAVWFPPRERVLATMIGFDMSLLGTVLGFYLSNIFVTAKIESEPWVKVD